MVNRRQAKLTGICSKVTTRPRRVRRSISGQSIDVQGKIVVEKSWVFEGDCVNYDPESTENLSETDTGQDDWCKKHTWFLNTNLLSSQLCAKCNKRILTRRVAYKCTACKRLCHLKCAVQSKTDCNRIENKPSAVGDNMDLEQFVTTHGDWPDGYGDSRSDRKVPVSQVDQNMNLTDLKQLYMAQEENQEQSGPWDDASNCTTSRGQSKHPAKHRVSNMKHSFVKKCKSFKKKVTEMKDRKGHVTERRINSQETNVGSTMELCEETAEETKAAWVTSPVRTRLRQRQAEIQQQQQKQQQQQQQASEQRRPESIRKKLSQYKKPSYLRRNNSYDTELSSIKDRLDTVEQKIEVLERSVPNELSQWRALGQKFTEDEPSYRDVTTDTPVQEQSFRDASVRHLEAEVVPQSSGTTSDEFFIVGRDVSSSSPDDGHMMRSRSHVSNMSHVTDHVTKQDEDERLHSVGFSSKDDSLLPSGIPKRLRMDIPSDMSGTFIDHQTTSTPVTNREISFRSASRQYEQSNQVIHTNVTKVNVDTSFTEPAQTRSGHKEQTVERRSPGRKSRSSVSSLHNNSLLSNSGSGKGLSPHQVAVRSFLEKRRSSDSFNLPPQPRSPSPTECVERCLTNRTNSLHMSPGIVKSPCMNASPPMANSTFRNGQNTSMSSPASYTFRNDFVDPNQTSFERIEATDLKGEEQKSTNAYQHDSSASNLSYTYRNDSQMIRSYGEEDLPGFTRNHSFEQTGTRNIPDARELEKGDRRYKTDSSQIAVEVDIEMDAPRRHVPLAEARPSSPLSILNRMASEDGGSLTNVTELTCDYASSFAESAVDSQPRSRWINKDVHLFRREAGDPIGATSGNVDETGDGRKPPIPIKRRQRSSSEFDFLKEAQRSLEKFKNRRSLDEASDSSHVSLRSLPRPSALDTDSTTDDGSEVKEIMRETFSAQRTEAVAAVTLERFIDHMVQDGDDNTTEKKQTFSAEEYEEIDREVLESNLNQRKYGHLMTSMERLESQIILQKPVSNGDYPRSGGSSIKSDARSSKSDVAKYHFLNDKGMVKISSPGMQILSDSPAHKKYRGERCSDINEESSLDLAETESEMSGIVVDNYFHTSAALGAAHSDHASSGTHKSSRRHSNDHISETETAVADHLRTEEGEDTLRQLQAERENDILEECLKTVDSHDAMTNILQWMSKDYVDPQETAELEQELHTLMQQSGERDEEEESARGGDMSLTDGSVYYSFRGQSGELRQLLSPISQTALNTVQDDLNDDNRFTGLMDTILNGSVEDVARLLSSDRTICETEIKDALLWALENKHFAITKLLLEDVQKLLVAAEREKVIDVYPAYRESNRWRPIFVVFSKKDVAGEWDLFMGVSVYRRRYDLESREVNLLTESEQTTSNPLSEEAIREMQQIIYQSNLQQYHSRVTAIVPSPCRSMKGGRELRQEICVAIHCPVKGFIPFFEEPFPSVVSGIPVDVRQGWFGSGCASSTTNEQTDGGHNRRRKAYTGSQSQVTRSSGSRSASSQCLSGSNSDLSVRTRSNDDLQVHVRNVKGQPSSHGDKNKDGPVERSAVQDSQQDYLDLDEALLLRTLAYVDSEEAKVMEKVD